MCSMAVLFATFSWRLTLSWMTFEYLWVPWCSHLMARVCWSHHSISGSVLDYQGLICIPSSLSDNFIQETISSKDYALHSFMMVTWYVIQIFTCFLNIETFFNLSPEKCLWPLTVFDLFISAKNWIRGR